MSTKQVVLKINLKYGYFQVGPRWCQVYIDKLPYFSFKFGPQGRYHLSIHDQRMERGTFYDELTGTWCGQLGPFQLMRFGDVIIENRINWDGALERMRNEGTA